MKSMKKILCLLIAVAMMIPLFSFVTFAAPVNSNGQSCEGFNAVAYQDGVYLTWSIPTANNAPQGYSWYEIAMCEEEPDLIDDSLWGTNGNTMQQYFFRYCFKLKRGSHTYNNSLYNRRAFINEDSVFALDASWNPNVPAQDRTKNFENTPGKTYYFYILGYVNNKYYALGRIVYTVPSDPTLSVAADGLENTLTYTINKGKDGAIYRYDSETKAQAGGNDYDKKIDVTYGGAPVTDTVDADGTYYYVLKQDISTPVAPITGADGANTAATEVTYDLTGVTVKFNFDQQDRIGQCVNIHTNGINTCRGGENGAAHTSYCPGNHNGPFSKLNARIADSALVNNGLNLNTDTVRFTFDNTEPLSYEYRNMGSWGLDVTTNLKLMPGVTYNMKLTQTRPGNVYVGSYVTITVPWYLSSSVVSATNAAPKSWITDMEVAGEGVVDIKISIPDGTWWSEVSIFTHEPPDPRTIIDNKLDRGTRNAVITGAWEGTIGPNNTDYDLPFAFVDGTTYYVYVSRCVNPYGSTVDEVWDVNPVAYRFTYNAPQATPEPTPTPTPVPTPTVVPDDDDNGTADISVVLYAITALAGAGAVVAIKRKKA